MDNNRQRATLVCFRNIGGGLPGGIGRPTPWFVSTSSIRPTVSHEGPAQTEATDGTPTSSEYDRDVTWDPLPRFARALWTLGRRPNAP